MQLGIMQGRLSPARARPQSFPWESWQAEFDRARFHGFDLIEWVFDAVRYEENPIWTEAGLAQIRERTRSSGVSVETICADYFVQHPLLRAAQAERDHHIEVLNALVTRASQLGARVVVIPVLEVGEIQNVEEQVVLLECLRRPLTLARAVGVRLAVESNMPADRYLQLITQAGQPALGICFDTGNRTALGSDIVADIGRLAPYVCGVHIKDRLLNGPNVPLGEGAAPFDKFFSRLAVSGYSGPLILETTVRDDYEYHARRNLDFVRSRLSRTGRKALQADV
jgi:L-ribulose-5-phosphate 3-epimerase